MLVLWFFDKKIPHLIKVRDWVLLTGQLNALWVEPCPAGSSVACQAGKPTVALFGQAGDGVGRRVATQAGGGKRLGGGLSAAHTEGKRTAGFALSAGVFAASFNLEAERGDSRYGHVEDLCPKPDQRGRDGQEADE